MFIEVVLIQFGTLLRVLGAKELPWHAHNLASEHISA